MDYFIRFRRNLDKEIEDENHLMEIMKDMHNAKLEYDKIEGALIE